MTCKPTSRMRLKEHLLITLISLTTLYSCIDEDVTSCVTSQSGVVLTYDFHHNMSYSNLFEQQVGVLKTFIFDENGVLCNSIALNHQTAVTHLWSQQVELAPGTYTFVTWAGDANVSESFKIGHENNPIDPEAEDAIIGTTQLTDLRAFLKCDIAPDNDDRATPQKSPINDLFHGIVRNIVVTKGQMAQAHTSLIKNTNTIAIKIGKLSVLSREPLTEDNFSMQLISRNGHYQYDNSINEYTRLLTYAPHENCVKEDSLCIESKTLRLLGGSDAAQGEDAIDTRLMLSISYQATGRKNIICEDLDLVNLILSSRIEKRNEKGEIVLDGDKKPIWVYPTKEYLDRQDRFEITFSINNDDGEGNITITVNGWTIINIKPEDPLG